MPKVSVIIPVFNREAYIADAVNSTLLQTFRDLELIIIDDGSTDRTPEILNSFDDQRIKILRNDTSMGIPGARNRGMSAASGKYIAWLDSDDMMAPDRISVQTGYLDNYKEVAMVGACARKCNAYGHYLRGIRVPPLADEDIRAWLLFRSPFQHSSIIGRSDVFLSYPYREDLKVCEDLDLFIRLTPDHKLVNLPRLLITRRIHETQSLRVYPELLRTLHMELLSNRLKQLGMDIHEDDMQRHFLLANMKQRHYYPDMEFLDWTGDWLNNLLVANTREGYCSYESMIFVTGLLWMVACWHARTRTGLRGYETFLRSPLSLSLMNRNGRKWLMRYMSLVFCR